MLDLFHLVLLCHSWRHHLGLGGRIACPTTPSDASGSIVYSSGTVGFSAPDSSVTPTTPASAPEDPAVPTVATGAAVDPSAVDANRSSLPSPVEGLVDSSIGYRAPGDSGMGSTGISPVLGPAFGCRSVWTGGVGSIVRLALHQNSSSVITKFKKLQQSNSKTRMLMVWSASSIS